MVEAGFGRGSGNGCFRHYATLGGTSSASKPSKPGASWNMREFFRQRSSRAERSKRWVLVGLLTNELECQAFSSIRTVDPRTNNGNKRGNTLWRSITAAGPFRDYTGFPVRRSRQAAEPATSTT
jgi:hypothetical protein